MRLTFKSVQEQAIASGYQVEKAASGYTVNGQKFRLLVEVADYLNRCLEVTVAPEFTVHEVQAIALQMGFLVQPADAGYEIYFEGQLLGLAKKLSEVVEALPEYKEAIRLYHEQENTAADDYLFHQDPQPVKLPEVGDTHFIGNYLLRCLEIGGEEATVWDVIESGIAMGEIKMGWDCQWLHTLSFAQFATPQEAIADLHESALLLKESELPEIQVLEKRADEFVTHNSRNGHYYVVRPNHPIANQRCECGDCYYRGAKCKHQKAVFDLPY